MAYNKNNYDNQRLTPMQEKFVQGIMENKTQTDAYLEAYPSAKNWERKTVWERASTLMNNNKVKTRLQELGYRDTKKIEWTRKKALETINYVMEMNKEDIERIAEACQTEIDLWEAKLMAKGQEMVNANGNTILQLSIAKEMQDITEMIQKLKKQKRMNSTNMKGIYEGAKILNRMFGYDITKVEIANNDEERQEMEKLTVDELKALVGSIDKGGE